MIINRSSHGTQSSNSTAPKTSNRGRTKKFMVDIVQTRHLHQILALYSQEYNLPQSYSCLHIPHKNCKSRGVILRVETTKFSNTYGMNMSPPHVAFIDKHTSCEAVLRSGSTQESQSATQIGSAKWQSELIQDKIVPRILASEPANILYLKRINGTRSWW